MTIAKIALMSLICLTTMPAASAAVMTFSGIPSDQIIQSTYTENGITAANTENVFWGYPSGEVLHFDAVDFGNSTYTFTYGSGLFDLVSFDVPFFTLLSSAELTAFDEADNITRTGSFDLSAGGTISFADWTGIAKLQIVNPGTDLSGHFSMDNFTIRASAGAVPEPTSWALMVGGFGVLGLALRSRGQAAFHLG